MATLNVSLPDQLKEWVSQQINTGQYSSASDYLRDLIRNDKRKQERSTRWLSDHLDPLLNTPTEEFETVTSEEIKSRARKRLSEVENKK